MTGPALAFLLLILASTGIMIVLFVGLFRQGMRVVRAMTEASDVLLPVADEIGRGMDDAARHMDRLAERIAAIRSPR